MNQGRGLLESEGESAASPVAPPAFLVETEPWHRVFLGNLAGQFGNSEPSHLQLLSAPGRFWPDVFVASPLPWTRFVESICYHLVGMAALWMLSQSLPQATQIVDRPVFSKDDVIYYRASEYLPPLDTGGQQAHLPRKGDPEHARQPILSVPPDPDNSAQTIVAPPQIKLNREVPLPNVVASMPVRATVPVSAPAWRPPGWAAAAHGSA